MSEFGLGCEPCWQGVEHFLPKGKGSFDPTRVEGLSDQTGARVALSGLAPRGIYSRSTAPSSIR
jgi:hypothetical protein